MVYFVGSLWATIFAVLAIGSIIVGIFWLIRKLDDGDKPIGASILLLAGIICGYLWIFAACHFKVGINERALLINTVDQTVIGEYGPGVQNKSLISSVSAWPANTQYQVLATMKGGTQSATTRNDTSVYDDVELWLDLSNMDLAAAYKAVNGDWDYFLEKNLLPGILSISRNVSMDYLTSEHTSLRDQWVEQFEKEFEAYLSNSNTGFGLKLVKGRTIMSWDFVNEADAKAYDDANRAAYQITQKENEKKALLIEDQMVEIRNSMLSKTADGTIINLQKMSDFLMKQPPEVRVYLISYMNNMADMEYLRIIGQEKPEIIIPPNGSVITSIGGTNDTYIQQPEASTTEDNKK